MTSRLKFILTIALAALCHPLFSQDLSVQAPKIVAYGEQFTVVFSAEGSKVSDFKWEHGEDFNLVWGPVSGTSRNFTSINGKSSRTVIHTYSYVLEAKNEGSFKLPPASAVIEGKEYTTSPLDIEVIARSSASGSSSGQSSQGDDDHADSSGDVFMTLSLNKTRAVVGEPIIATLKLYTNADLSGVENPQFPVFNGFWSQEIDAPVNLNFQRENVDGRLYQSALLRRYMLIPQQSGQLTIEPAEMVAVVIVRNSSRGGASIFDNFFDSYQTVRRRLRTDSYTVNVSPLPDGAPESFRGGVGRFSMEVSANSDTLKAHEAGTVTVTVTGNGNVSLIEPPTVVFPADFESYDVKVSDSGGKGMSGTKKYEFPFIPRTPGTFDIPSVEYSYYDVSTRKYVTLRSEPLRITVLKGEDGGGRQESYSPGVNRQSVKNLNEDIRFIATGNPSFSEKDRFFVASPLFFILSFAVVAVFLVTVFVARKYIRMSSDVVSSRNRKATKMAMRRLHAAGAYLKEGIYSAFYEELHKALLGYVSDKLAIDVVDMTKENMSLQFAGHGVSEEIKAAFMALLDACEFARYSPQGSHDAMQNHYNEAVRIISTMDGMIKNAAKGFKGVKTTAVIVLMLAAGSFWQQARGQDVSVLWTEANADYEAGEWDSALEKYNAILASGVESDRLYYNMGNACYKAGDISHAILNYERALRLNPSFEDARNNLDMASSLTVDRIDNVPEFILKTWLDNCRRSMGSDSWAVVFIVLFALAALSFLAFMFIKAGRGVKITFFVAGIVFVVFSAISIAFSLKQRADCLSEDYAVIVSAVSPVRSSPSDENTKSLFMLHEGTKVEILEELGEWSKVEIADGRQGWIQKEDMEII